MQHTAAHVKRILLQDYANLFKSLSRALLHVLAKSGLTEKCVHINGNSIPGDICGILGINRADAT